MYQSTYFTYKGISSEQYNLKIVTMEKTFTEIFGYAKDIQTEQRGNGSIFTFKPTIKIPETRQLLIAHVDEWDRPLKHTTQWKKEVADWLLNGDNFSPIWFDENEDDLCYYMNIIRIDKWDNFNSQGYFTITLMLMDDCLYTRPINEHYINFSSTTPRSIQILNSSNVDREIRPYMEIENLQGETNVKITNRSTGQIVELKNLPLDCKVQLFNDVQIPNINKNTYEWNDTNFNFEWFYLKDGMNYVDILGKCSVSFNLSYPIVL